MFQLVSLLISFLLHKNCFSFSLSLSLSLSLSFFLHQFRTCKTTSQQSVQLILIPNLVPIANSTRDLVKDTTLHVSEPMRDYLITRSRKRYFFFYKCKALVKSHFTSSLSVSRHSYPTSAELSDRRVIPFRSC